MQYFACMPSISWLPCELQPFSPLPYIAGFIALVILVLCLAGIAYRKGAKQNNKEK